MKFLSVCHIHKFQLSMSGDVRGRVHEMFLWDNYQLKVDKYFAKCSLQK